MGSANGTANHALPFRFRINIPFQRAVNPVTNTNFEGAGVKPDLIVDETLAFQAAMREIVARNPAKYAALESDIENQSGVDAFVEDRLLKFRDQPQTGGEAAVRSLLSGIASGQPDYARMSNTLAQTVRDDLDFFRKDMRAFGEAKSIRFTGVNSMGLDDYEVRSETAAKRFSIYLDAYGKIVTAGFYPTVPLPPPPR